MKQSSRTCWMVAGMVAATVAACAAEQTIIIRDWTGRGFAPEVISYDVPSAGAANLRVTGPDGSPLPVQIMPGAAKDRAVLIFPADLPKDATMTYKVSCSSVQPPPHPNQGLALNTCHSSTAWALSDTTAILRCSRPTETMKLAFES